MGLKFFLGNSPWYENVFYGVRAGSRWPHLESAVDRYMPFPFQLAYASALLEKHNYDILLVDGIAEKISEEAFLNRAVGFKPNLILLEVSTPSFNTDIQFTRRLRNRLDPGVKIAFCGPHALMFKTEFLDHHPEVDLVLIGEYELTMLNIARAMAEGKDFRKTPGLIYRDPSGKSISTGPPEIIKDVNSLPWPARHFLPMYNYWDQPGNIPEPTLQMWASRGCPFSCSYCIWPQVMSGNKYRPRDIHHILDEIEQVCAKYGFNSVYFDDDTFNIGKKRMLEFCKEKIRRKLDIPWAIMARADLMDREILESMADAGLWAVKYGVESAEPKLLAHVGKELNLRKAVENVELTKKLGIKVHLTFMFGIPGETSQTIKNSVRLAKKLAPDSIQFSILTPLPGTRIFDELRSKGHLLEADWKKFNGYFSSVIRTDDLSAKDLEKAVSWAWRSWYRHNVLHNLSRENLSQMLGSIPTYLRHPIASLNQLKRLLNV
jgi:radical SAM superfamily enzyme YgiQ (UPF0313 family)